MLAMLRVDFRVVVAPQSLVKARRKEESVQRKQEAGSRKEAASRRKDETGRRKRLGIFYPLQLLSCSVDVL